MFHSHAVLLFLALPAAPLGNADTKDIQCQDVGQYIGGIDRTYTLKVSGPKEKTWEYTFATTGGQAGDIKISGTYELLDDLVIFSGKTDKGTEVRFGLNYGFPDGKVEFNGFFANGETTLRYHRKWFQKIKGEWKPTEDLVLTMPRSLPTDAKWSVPMKGEHVRWDAAGKETRTRIDETLVYQDQQLQKPRTDRLPAFLLPVSKDKQLQAAFPDRRGAINTSGWLRGFAPDVAKLNDK